MRLAFHEALAQEFEKSDKKAAVRFNSPFSTHALVKRAPKELPAAPVKQSDADRQL